MKKILAIVGVLAVLALCSTRVRAIISTNPNSTSASTVTGVVSSANGGWGTLNELGTITNGGTATCNFSGTLSCHFTVASGASFTLANPTNLPANSLVIIKWTQVGGGIPTITWGTHFFSFDASNQTVDAISGQPQQSAFMYFTATAGTDLMSVWSTDGTGTNLTAFMGANELRVNDLFANQQVASTLMTATGGLVNGCTWTVTLATGAGQVKAACLSNFAHVAYQPGGTQTGAVTTPTAVSGNVFCAQTAANSTTVNCTSSNAADARLVQGIGY